MQHQAVGDRSGTAVSAPAEIKGDGHVALGVDLKGKRARARARDEIGIDRLLPLDKNTAIAVAACAVGSQNDGIHMVFCEGEHAVALGGLRGCQVGGLWQRLLLGGGVLSVGGRLSRCRVGRFGRLGRFGRFGRFGRVPRCCIFGGHFRCGLLCCIGGDGIGGLVFALGGCGGSLGGGNFCGERVVGDGDGKRILLRADDVGRGGHVFAEPREGRGAQADDAEQDAEHAGEDAAAKRLFGQSIIAGGCFSPRRAFVCKLQKNVLLSPKRSSFGNQKTQCACALWLPPIPHGEGWGE